ncbi:MAG TPA: hypothetical protein VGW76_12885 [Pyrinomonadaceae bacterium]|nr:hypothetical protein [Pyrinomonadaceae bacterium]
MISPKLRNFIYVLLVFLVILDVVLSTTCLLFPDKWFMTFHGVPYDNLDVEGLLKRTGAVWVAFTLLQLIALFRWRKAPWWLVLIAGVRLTELFSDWVYIYVAHSMTTLGTIGLFISPPGNLAFGIFLIWAYKKIMKCGGGPVIG